MTKIPLAMKPNPVFQDINVRTPFIDHIRIVLTALVIFHHTAITYGAEGGWYYHEVVTQGAPMTLSTILLIALCATDQAFFMGFFLLIPGYFTPLSLERKGTRQFMLDRLKRLGIPMLVYGFVLGPITIALAETTKGYAFIDVIVYLWKRGSFNIGPLWFSEALLILAAGFLLWRMARPRVPKRDDAPLPGHMSLLISALLAGIAAFVIRLWVPVGSEVWSMQLGYFASYVFLFSLGCAAWHHRWLERVDGRLVRPWWVVTWFAIPALPFIGVMSGALQGAKLNFLGGWNVTSLSYALQEPFVAWGIILMLLWKFRLRFNQATPFGRKLAERAYTVYIIHPPVLVGVSLLLRGWEAPVLFKFAVTGSAACMACMVLAGLILRLPGAKRVL